MSTEVTRPISEETSYLEETVESAVLLGRPLIGEQAEIELPGYQLISVLGKGGMGTVFLALQERLQRHVAVKMLAPELAVDQRLSQRLEREAQTLASLSHPNIVACHDIMHHDGNTFVIMECVPGHLSVRDIIRRFEAVPEEVAIKIVLEAARGLAYAHEKGIVHRDIKPDNLLLVYEGEVVEDDPLQLFAAANSRTMIVDFGIAKGGGVLDGAAEDTGDARIMGSPAYMAPEQARNTESVDFRADIYALGTTLYHLLTGNTPFDSDSPMATVRKKMEQDLPDPRKGGARVSVECVTILRGMTGRNPEDRYSSYTSLVSELDHLLAMHQSATAGVGGLSYAWPRRAFAYIAATILCLAAAGAYVAVQTMRSKSNRPLSTVPAEWAGLKAGWRIDVLDDESREIGIINTGSKDLLVLDRELSPRVNVMVRARLPKAGWLAVSLRTGDTEAWRLRWERRDQEQRWLRSSGEASTPLSGIVDKEIYDWHQLAFQIHPNQVVLWIDGQLTDIAPFTPPLEVFHLALSAEAGQHAQFASLEAVELRSLVTNDQ
ncbi:MAG: serine/threonine protein kinase [Lentisphaerae bacterium]|jgi:tRNA A-37 threonylcarbamoyl transferase component Bud32|nr:serine/threonine protein kinase [Lentisphaerota bacterium]MBT4823302.1 serine/threonine protein kinase [Lentisphaerota bacterium]MBT5609824.1 serine/threonine protein kinase [Lentisphaerota bacterium]MBT7055142.1 serine/threonine protein kinase [Lentisphaerota bacterium]MBT7846314.1 serine/threonine protein kinase [Lentisphaerota bacterium]